MADQRVYSVSELTAVIKALLESEVGSVWIEGELSNVRRPASGHCYFTLKDESAQISAVLFRGSLREIRFPVEDGLRVRLFGDLTVYARGGNYQVIVRSMDEAGRGSLQQRFEKLKAALQAEGLFDTSRKKPIPVLPRHVGVVTSPTGAAIRDILSVVSRRFPNLHVLLAPVRVQGEGAAAEIAAAIDTLNRRGGLDVMIVGRGGGSVEDLWCFNEEVVARAIARSTIPVISAVGHEIDFTISDFVADLRAATPSAAAELLVGRKEAFEENIEEKRRRIVSALKGSFLEAAMRLEAVRNAGVFHEPANIARSARQRMDAQWLRMSHALSGTVRDTRQALDEHSMKMMHRAELSGRLASERLERAKIRLEGLSPLSVLKRGYTITFNAKGHVVRSVGDVAAGEKTRTCLADGEFESSVTALRRQASARPAN
jgi:exodeoxyribonuclease VII large subunit